MKLLQFMKRLEDCKEEIINNGGDVEACDISIETTDDTGEIYYENSLRFYVDSRNDIGISPKNK